jgi:hypothetical protein
MYERATPVQIRARWRDILSARQRPMPEAQNTAIVAFIRLKSHNRCRRSRDTVGRSSASSEQLHVRFPNSQPKPVPCWLPPTAHASPCRQSPPSTGQPADGGAAACGTHAHLSFHSPCSLSGRYVTTSPPHAALSAGPPSRFKPVATADLATATAAPGRHNLSGGVTKPLLEHTWVFTAPPHRPVTAPADSGGA